MEMMLLIPGLLTSALDGCEGLETYGALQIRRGGGRGAGRHDLGAAGGGDGAGSVGRAGNRDSGRVRQVDGDVELA